MRRLFLAGGLIGLLIGLSLGLGLARSIQPWLLTGASSADLRLELKDDYLRMIAADYMLDGNMALASRRVGALHLADLLATLDRTLQSESRPVYRQALLFLARDLDDPAVALARPTFTPRPTTTRAAPSAFPPAPATAPSALPGDPTLTPTAAQAEETEMPLPPALSTLVPSTPAGTGFAVQSYKSLTCPETGGSNTIQVFVEDEQGRPMPGVAIGISWDGGDEIVYTGLKPERGMGYADLGGGRGIYGVRMIDWPQSDIISGLKIAADALPCPEETSTYGWRIVFRKKN